ncbi:MAG: oligopeptide/dipeptide ABC transporter ATP-binding protein [Acidimicrobiales bacterium]
MTTEPEAAPSSIPASPGAEDDAVLDVTDLSISFTRYVAGLRRRRLEVVSGLDLMVRPGEVVAVVGSSGSGKSLLAHAVLGILPPNAVVGGTIRYRGTPLDERRLRRLRGREIALIPQSVNHLDPVHRTGTQVERAAYLAGHDQPGARASGALTRLGLDAAAARRYPFELSGGMARRALTAIGTVGHPRLVIADEPTPGLHPEVVVETLRALRSLADGGAGVVLITHDLAVSLTVADTVVTFYAGSTVEAAPASAFTGHGAELRHPYTSALWAALPANGFTPLPGAQPLPDSLPSGCLFADRCPMATIACEEARPEPRPVGRSIVRCIHA